MHVFEKNKKKHPMSHGPVIWPVPSFHIRCALCPGSDLGQLCWGNPSCCKALLRMQVPIAQSVSANCFVLRAHCCFGLKCSFAMRRRLGRVQFGSLCV